MKPRWKLVAATFVLVALSAQTALACYVLPPHAKAWARATIVEPGEKIEIDCRSWVGGFTSVLLAVFHDNGEMRPAAFLAADARPRRTFISRDAEGVVRRRDGRMWRARLSYMPPSDGVVRIITTFYGGESHCSFEAGDRNIWATPQYGPLQRTRLTLGEGIANLNTTMAFDGEGAAFFAAESGTLVVHDETGDAHTAVGARPMLGQFVTVGTYHYSHVDTQPSRAVLWWIQWPDQPADS